MKKLIALSALLLASKLAVGADNRASLSAASDYSGVYSLVEWNPADLLKNRVRVAGEYLLVDGFAFGAAVEYQENQYRSWRCTSMLASVTATQYLQSQSLNGPYVKGEFDIYGADVTVRANDRNGLVFGSALGADLGYRFAFLEGVTGAASYGVRRYIPGFFETRRGTLYEFYDANTDKWEAQVQLALGLSF